MQSNPAWTSKYLPKKSSDIVGQAPRVQKLKLFLDNFHKSKKKAALLYGLTGCGKTSSVYAVASDLNYEVLEINSSDFRNAASINSILGTASSQRSLLAKGKILLVDELDGISGQKDRGGVPALCKIVAKSAFPIVATATDPWIKKLSSIRKISEMIEFPVLSYNDIHAVLSDISIKEEIMADADCLKTIAVHAGGDLRAAINDLQILSQGSRKISKSDADSLSDRNRVEAMVLSLVRIFKTTNFQTAVTAFDNIQEKPEEWLLWIDENIPKAYTEPKSLEKAYKYLSKADIYNRRIRRNQYWRLLVYIKIMLTAGISSAKDKKLQSTSSYKQSSRPLKIWMANARYNKRKNIASKIADKTHTSAREVIKESLPFFRNMITNSSYKDELIEELDLDKEEVEWLSK